MALPPPYEQPPVYNQLPSVVIGDPSPPHVTAQEAIVVGLATPETRTRLMQQVEALADRALEVNEDFERIRVGLGKVDEKNYKDKDGKPVDKFQPTWIGYKKRWTDLLWTSRSVATSTEAYISDFLETIIPQVEAIQNNIDLADARADLEAFINRINPFKLNPGQTVDIAHRCCQDFEDLRHEIEEFKTKFDDFANFISGGDLDRAIEHCAVWITRLRTGLVATGAIGAVGLLGLWSVGAATVIPWVVGSCAVAGVVEGAALLYKKSQERKLNDLKAVKGDMTHIDDSLKNFSTIWGTVRHDAQLINEGLCAAVGDRGSMRAFQRRVTRVRNSYSTLGEALSLYATKVNNSGSTAPTAVIL